MISFIFGVLFAAITLLVIALQRTYKQYPVKELKRRARKGDPLAQLLYRPVSYGMSLQLLLGLVLTASAAVTFALFADAFATWFSVFIVASLLWLGYLWLPPAGLNGWSRRILRTITPAIERALSFLHPVLRRVAGFVQRFRHVHVQTGLYEKEDIVALLDRQQQEPENRIPSGEIDLLRHALTFADKEVRDVLVPQRSVKSVLATESIGPKLMDELYGSGFSRFPVVDPETTGVIGTLYMRDLVQKKATGVVRECMRKDVYYVHEDFTLYQVLQAFLKTKHHLFIVVNSFEESVGIVTIEDILEQIIGRPIVDEFDAYEDMRAVAAAAAKKEHAARQKARQEPTEVIE